AMDPHKGPKLVAERVEAEEYDVAHNGDALFIRTNRDAEDFRIVRAPADDPQRERWEDIVPHRPGILIVDMIVFADYLVWLERENALPRIVIRRLADGDEHQIAFDEEAYALGLQEGHEFLTSTLRFSYSSMTTPTEVWDYDMATRTRRLRKRQRVPSGHDPAHYVTRRLIAPAKDGEGVPVSLLYHADTPIDGTAPCLLYGYGAYGITIPSGFNANALSLVNRGFVYAIAHVRGGMDKGFAWYANGRREHKENTFDDFVAAAEHLTAEGFAAPGRIAAQGGSAGGMLMGAVANRAPDRFGAIIAEVPFVDVLETMLDETLPLTPPEWPEWGDPIRDEAAFLRIKGYSPMDNVAAQAYPDMIVLAGVSDPRVTYWEPAKWVARLRANATNDPLIVLRTNMGAGHGGASGRFKRLEEVALVQAFALARVGNLAPSPSP
ncbi:MAG: prolyl oligopeptidase family serine peptidase, partial [Pseudomonadota bacterium]